MVSCDESKTEKPLELPKQPVFLTVAPTQSRPHPGQLVAMRSNASQVSNRSRRNVHLQLIRTFSSMQNNNPASQGWEGSAETIGARAILARKRSVPPGSYLPKKPPKFSDESDSDKDNLLMERDDDDVGSSSGSKALSYIPGLTNMNERVILNVGGQVHETFLATLNRLPETRLAKLAQDYERDQAYDAETGTFFFNRNPIIFVSILQYYRTGELHIDHNICGNAIKNELDFWQIDANDIEPCCWAQYAKFLENKETLKMLDDSFAIYEDVFAEPENEVGWRRLQRRLWRHIEDPSYSVVGKVFASLSIFFVILSIFSYVLETHKYFRVPRNISQLVNVSDDSENSGYYDKNGNFTRYNYTHYELRYKTVNISLTDPEADFFEITESNSVVVWYLSVITFTCFAWFAVEYLFRVICCPNKAEFFKSMLNNLDLLVLLAMTFETLAIILVDQIPRSRYLRVLIPLRFARIIRIMKLMKHYRAFKVLVYTIKVSAKELALMIIFLMIGVVIFACLVYYVEPETFDNIPIGCWWALVTMTTVGYGDYHPTKIGGYIIGCVAAIFGVLMIAFTVPIVVNNFSLYYSHAQTRAKMRPKRRATKLLNKLAALTMFVPTLKEIQEAAEEERLRQNLKKKPSNESGVGGEKDLTKTESKESSKDKHKGNKKSGGSHSSDDDSGMEDKKAGGKKGLKAGRRMSIKPISDKSDSKKKPVGEKLSSSSNKLKLSELDEMKTLPSVQALQLPTGQADDQVEDQKAAAMRRRAFSVDRKAGETPIPTIFYRRATQGGAPQSDMQQSGDRKIPLIVVEPLSKTSGRTGLATVADSLRDASDDQHD